MTTEKRSERKRNWIYHMQQGLQSMWTMNKKKKDTVWEENALDLGRISAFGKVNIRRKDTSLNTTNPNRKRLAKK